MMFCVLKAPKSLSNLTFRAVAASVAVFLFHFEPSFADPGQAKPKWGTQLETDAEFAYRSVYERFMADYRRGQAPLPHENPPDPDTGAVADIPELPGRKDSAGSSENSTADLMEAETGAAQDAIEERPAELLTLSLIGRPRNLGDVITTQAANDGDDAGGQPGFAPRDRGSQYCTNIATAAADARFLWQQKQLLETEEQVKNRIADLEAKIAEYRKWLARRDEFSRKAQGSVTNIYAKMRPDAAAQQLMALDEEMAAASSSRSIRVWPARSWQKWTPSKPRG